MATLEATSICQFIIINAASFHLWLNEKLLSHQRVSKYYGHDYLQNFIMLFMSLLTALTAKKHPRPNLKGFQYQIWTMVKRLGK